MAKRTSNNGKALETLVAIIQQSYENTTDIKVEQNAKLLDKDGRSC